jgi:predicted RNase H-like HicB family nuclease
MRLTCSLTAVYVQGETDVVAYIPEIPGAYGQGPTIEEARACLAEALGMILAAHRQEAARTYGGSIVVHREPIILTPRKSDN